MTQGIRCKGTAMRAAGAACLSLLLLSAPWNSYGKEQAGPVNANQQLNHSLKILYAGRPGSDREKDFVGFLKKYFDVVQTGNLETFKETDTQGFDVTLLDWDPNTFHIDDFPLTLSRSFSRPVMTFGVPGGYMCNRWRLKTRYN